VHAARTAWKRGRVAVLSEAELRPRFRGPFNFDCMWSPNSAGLFISADENLIYIRQRNSDEADDTIDL
jgi:hypothetical protein